MTRLQNSGEKRHPLSEIIRGFKTFSARSINERRGTIGTRVWKRNYYERVIRNDKELERIGEYIIHNPLALAEGKGRVSNPPVRESSHAGLRLY